MNDTRTTPAVAKAKARTKSPQRRGRILALQVLYEVDVTKHDWQASLLAHAEAVGASDTVLALAERNVGGVVGARDDLDALLARHAPMWPVEQLPVVDRNVLRLALYELQPGSDVPPKVAINEAIELAKDFGGEHSSRFVNGVLGSALEELAPGESAAITHA